MKLMVLRVYHIRKQRRARDMVKMMVFENSKTHDGTSSKEELRFSYWKLGSNAQENL